MLYCIARLFHPLISYMKLRIFYSWQTSTDQEGNKKLISKAIEKAIKKVKKKHPGRFDEIVIDRDTQSVPGMPPVAETIEEKISNCDIFIGDFTVENHPPLTLWEKIWGRRKSNIRPGPNGNVMMEFGYAKAKLSNDRLIGVMNLDCGNPHEDSSLLPFDMRYLRFPISYSSSQILTDTTDEKRERFVIGIYAAINEIIKNSLEKRWQEFLPFLDWTNFLKIEGELLPFIETTETKRIVTAIQDAAQNQKTITRILGLSGLGKTRLIIEAFRAQKEEDSIVRSERLLYFDSSTSDIDINQKVLQLAFSKETKYLIVDNCDLQLHSNLAKIVRSEGSQLSLITIYTNPEEHISSGTTSLILDPEKLVDLVENLVDNLNPDLSVENRRLIKMYAHGFPLVATILTQNIRNNREDIGAIGEKWIVDKLLGKEGENEQKRKAIRALSLFSRIGYEGEMESQIKAISTNPKINYLSLDEQQSEVLFRKLCTHYLARKLFEKRGRYLLMRPIILSISLAEEWWDECLESEIPQLLVDLEKAGLTESFCQQWRHLGYHSRSKEIAAKLTGPNGPFAKAEVLNTEPGSLLFRYIVEVNPESCAQAALAAFNDLSIKEIRLQTKGRRNLVWALEKLVWHKEVFDDAGRALLLLAAGENENHISNNAQSSFLQLFQIGIPPTQASLEQRAEMIEFCLNNDFDEVKQLGISALDRSLQGQGFTRIGGSERQGSRLPMESDTPTWKEIRTYWKKSITALEEIGRLSTSTGQIARDILLKRFREVSINKAFFLIFPVIKSLNQSYSYDPPQLLEKLNTTIQYNSPDLQEEERQQIREFIAEINASASSFNDRYRLIVGRPNYIVPGKKASETSEEVRKTVKDFAEEITSTEFDLQLKFEVLFSQDQRENWYFGNCVAEKRKEVGKSLLEIALPALDFLCNVPNEEQSVNVGFLKGFLSRFHDQGNVDVLTAKILKMACLHPYAVGLIASFPLEFEAYKVLFKLVEKDEIPIVLLSEFRYRFEKFPIETVFDFCDSAAEFGLSGAVVAIEVLSSFSYSDAGKWNQVRNRIRELIINQKCILNANKVPWLDSFAIFDCARKLIDGTKDKELAIQLMEQVLEKLRLPNYHANADVAISNLTIQLVEQYFPNVWPQIGAALLSEEMDFLFYLNLKALFGAEQSIYGKGIGSLFKGDLDLIFEWARSGPAKASVRLGSLLPTMHQKEDSAQVSLHPFTLRVLDEFGENEDFIKELSSQFHSYSWTGSLVPFLSSQKSVFEELLKHRYVRVQNWARNEIEYLEKRIKAESNFDEERTF